MIKIAVDCLGGDNGTPIIIEAIKKFISINKDVEIFAFGKKEQLTEIENIAHIIDARENVSMTAGALDIIRTTESSIVKGLKYMKEEHLNAFVSSGSTGAILSASTLILRNLPGIARSPIAISIPTSIIGKSVLILDCGASLDNTANQLAKYALLGRLYSKYVLGIDKPKTYILSNGSEEGKGNALSKETYQLLKDNNFPDFYGNIEANKVTSGIADVVVTDGFTGNVLIKSLEGAIDTINSLLSKAAHKYQITNQIKDIPNDEFAELTNALDYKRIGGALLLGVNGIVVKSHGSSGVREFMFALESAKKAVENKVLEHMKGGLENENNI